MRNFGLLAGLMLCVSSLASCSQARAQEDESITADRAALRTMALDAREQRAAGLAQREQVSDSVELACPEGTVAWLRAADLSICAARCTSDATCGKAERCVVLDDPSGRAVFAEDATDRFLESAALLDVAEQEPIVAEPPACEGECAPYSGDLTVVPQLPLALCDPLFDEVEEAAVSDAY